MKKVIVGILMKFIGIPKFIFGGIGSGISKISVAVFKTLQKLGVGVGYIIVLLLFAVGAAGVFSTDLPFKFLSLGLSVIVARVVGACLLSLAGFTLAHIVNTDAKIQAECISSAHEKSRQELNDTKKALLSVKNELEKVKDEREKDVADVREKARKELSGVEEKLQHVESELENREGEIKRLEGRIKEKDVELQRSARTINLASVKKVLKLGLIEADMTIYDFDNDRENLVKSKVKVEGPMSIGHHRPRYLWQYIGFREDSLKVIFGVDLRDLHFELGTDGKDRVIIVHGVKPEHSFKEHRTLQSFAMKRKIYLKEAQQAEELSPEAKDAEIKRCASMQVFEAFEGDKKKAWEVDESRSAEYTSSPNDVCKSVELQNNRIERIINGHKRDQFKALDDQVLEQVKEFLGVLLYPICDKIVIAIREDKPDQLEWTRIERLPGLEKFCEDFNNGRLLGMQR